MSATDTLTIQERLALRAERLKKTWIIATVMRGHLPRGGDAVIPPYESWSRTKLQRHMPDLESDVRMALEPLVHEPALGLREDSLSWMAGQFARWESEGFGLLVLSNASDFEERVAPLNDHGVLDIPPYAELLLQPGIEVAFRHPEYMLARDLECLHAMCRDAEALLVSVDWRRPPEWAPAASENAQGLARTTILACFNLLESFTSGLARAHCMLHPELEERSRERLLSNQDALRRRILAVPRQILGAEPPLDVNKPPFSALFGQIKAYRDSFVHCEPGTGTSSAGYVKERLFHDVSLALVEEAVSHTESAIRQIWFTVHGRPGPRWLPMRDDTGVTHRRNLSVCPPGQPAAAPHIPPESSRGQA